MDANDPLKTALLDLLHELREIGPPLILGGGYGLFLKQIHRQNQGSPRTLIPGELWPPPRSTEDLDIFLRAEVVVDAPAMTRIRDVLGRLEFQPVSGREYLQFKNRAGVKIDLLVGPLGQHEKTGRKKRDERRAGPAVSVGLHAHPTDEAVALEQDLIEIPIGGRLSSGASYEATVFVPQAFTYLLMKLFAFRDHVEKKNLNGQHHALDLYRVVAMMTAPEFETVERLGLREHRDNEKVREARQIVARHFSGPESLGVIRLREHPLFVSNMDVQRFLAVLHRIFPLQENE